MRTLLLSSLLFSVAAMAGQSGPEVSKPAHRGGIPSLSALTFDPAVDLGATAYARSLESPRIDKSLAVASNALQSFGGVTTQSTATVPAPYRQTATYRPLGAVFGTGFEGLGSGTAGFSIQGAPPDPTIGVSATQIVQWVNMSLAVYDKAGTPLLPAPGFVSGNSIWIGLPVGSLCRDFNRGNPNVQYDSIAQRWVLSQFAFNNTITQNALCIAVSKTSDALGGWWLYQYDFGNELPDFPKLSVWTDAYYISFNRFASNAASFTFAGGSACAYDKAAMLTGAAATQICFTSLQRFSFMPADLDGTRLPPAGTPNYHVSWNWAFTLPPYTMQLTKFSPNFTTPALSTFTDGFGGAAFSFVAFPLDAGTVAACNDYATTNCVPQPGTAQLLDSLGDRHAYRVVYRNFGTHDALLITQAVDAFSPASTANLRWWEIRSPGANPPTVRHNSTFVPDTDARWVSSAAFDKLGNIAIGYSASSSTMFPSIKVTGRLRNDPKNQLRTEALVQAGGGSQTTNLRRWGGWTVMQVDPVDDCTYWYTAQYQPANGVFNWSTRIASFKFPNCT